MNDRALGALATLAGAILLGCLLSGGGAGRYAAVVAAVGLPPLLIAIARREGRPRARWGVALSLALLLAAGSAGVLLLDAGGAGPEAGGGGLPRATRWMLVVLCALPWAVTSVGFALALRTPRR